MNLTQNIYRLSGLLAAAFLAGISLLIVAQIVARAFGAQIRSADDFAAWSMAAAIFLALPSTLIRGDHIRVTLIFGAVSNKIQRIMDIASTVIAVGIIGWGTWFVGEYVYESYIYHDVSQGIVAVPLWIPQSVMLIGMFLMEVAFIERFVKLVCRIPISEQGRGRH